MRIEKLTKSQIINTTIAAMAPYVCVTEFSDYEAQFGFAVYYGTDADERQVFEFRRRNVDRAPELIAALNDTRTRMSTIGVNFPEWDNKIHD